MGLDICPLLVDGRTADEYWPEQNLHYIWSRFDAMMRIIEYNALLTGVAGSKDDPTIVLIHNVRSCNTWSTNQCRDVHILIRKTFNASKFEPDPQINVAMEEHAQMVKQFQQSVMGSTGFVIEFDTPDDGVKMDEEEKDPFVPCARLKRAPDVSYYYCSDPDKEVIQFGETMAVFYTNGWGAGFF